MSKGAAPHPERLTEVRHANTPTLLLQMEDGNRRPAIVAIESET